MTTGGHALWLHDVLAGLGVSNAHVVGLSLGGRLALDFAGRYPHRVSSLTLITPGGVADRNIVIWALPLLLLGSWGAGKVQERILGPAEENPTDHQRKMSELSAAIFAGMRPRTSLPKIDDRALAALGMPVLVMLGADDVTMDSKQIQQRFEQFVPQAEVRIFPGKRHFLGNQANAIERFLDSTGR